MRTFDDIICEAAEAAILTNMTPIQFYKQCFYAYEEALKTAHKEEFDITHQIFRTKFREIAKSVDPNRVEGPYL